LSLIYPKFYWENREGTVSMAGQGTASACGFGPLFTWQNYCSRQSGEWQLFSPVAIAGKAVQQAGSLPFSPIRRLRSLSTPNRIEWEEKIQDALQAIRTGELDKVVVAKRVEVECEGPIDPFALFSALKKPGQTNFLLQVAPHTAFLGSSPERLYKREGRLIECDALAGTRPLRAKEELLTSEKDLHEFGIVKERIAGAIHPLSQSEVHISSCTLVCTPTVAHLHAKISATLKAGVDDRMILSALHPTPALGGWPKEKAAAWQREHEPFVRGLYGAPIGHYSEERAEFAVAIRSCLVVDSRVYLYAGTGIVKGSDPALEWEESEQKLVQWGSLFHG
jgi:menaquinone-specific isochorismate synthase